MSELRTIVRRAIEGDVPAFSQLVTRHRSFVYAICLSQVRQASERCRRPDARGFRPSVP